MPSRTILDGLQPRRPASRARAFCESGSRRACIELRMLLLYYRTHSVVHSAVCWIAERLFSRDQVIADSVATPRRRHCRLTFACWQPATARTSNRTIRHRKLRRIAQPSRQGWRATPISGAAATLEGWQDSMAGPLSSIVKSGGCEYVYTRNDWWFVSVDDLPRKDSQRWEACGAMNAV